jgi:hypothetical protein
MISSVEDVRELFSFLAILFPKLVSVNLLSILLDRQPKSLRDVNL